MGGPMSGVKSVSGYNCVAYMCERTEESIDGRRKKGKRRRKRQATWQSILSIRRLSSSMTELDDHPVEQERDKPTERHHDRPCMRIRAYAHAQLFPDGRTNRQTVPFTQAK